MRIGPRDLQSRTAHASHDGTVIQVDLRLGKEKGRSCRTRRITHGHISQVMPMSRAVCGRSNST